MDLTKAVETSQGVSIVIPAYNYANFLVEAVESALARDYAGPFEVLIVDDRSTNKTASVAGRFGSRVRYHLKDNAGLSAA
jgi:glycosyltransferase involved in cell wall biosynthesis